MTATEPPTAENGEKAPEPIGISAQATNGSTGGDDASAVAALREECAELRRRLSLVPRVTVDTALRIAELEKGYVSLRQARDNALAQINASAQRVERADMRVAELSDECGHLQKVHADAVGRLAASEAKCEELRSLLESKERVYTARIAELEAAKPTPAPQKAAPDPAMMAALKSAQEKVVALEKHIGELQKQHRTASTAVIDSAMKAQRERDQLLADLDKLCAERETWFGDRAKLEAELQAANRHLAQVEEFAASQAANASGIADVNRWRQQVADLSEQLNAAREEIRLAWAVRGAAAVPIEVKPTPVVPISPEVVHPIEGGEAQTKIDEMEGVYALAVAAPDPTELLGVLSEQFRNYGQGSICAGSIAAHRLASTCCEVLKWIGGNSSKLVRARGSLDGVFKVLSGVAKVEDAEKHADVTETSIYLVDDDQDNCDCIATSLDRIGIRTNYAAKAPLALKHLAENPYKLIILDVDLGDANGFDVHKEIRRMPHHADTPILFLSALSSAEANVAKLNPKLDAYMAKPYTLCELSLRLITMLIKARL